MSEWNTDTRLKALMDEQQQLRVIHEQRLTQVETRMTTLEIKVPYMEQALNKLTSIVEMQAKQGVLTEAAVVALKDGQEQHAKNIEDIKKEQVAQSNMTSRTHDSVTLLWRIIGTLGTALALAAGGYLFSLIQHPK